MKERVKARGIRPVADQSQVGIDEELIHSFSRDVESSKRQRDGASVRRLCVAAKLNGMDLIDARSIFSPATGFIRRGGFDWTCNPYLGCTFGCTYCYAMFLPQNRRPKSEWGRWFSAKQNAVALAEAHVAEAGRPSGLSVERDRSLSAGRALAATHPRHPRSARAASAAAC